MDRRATVIGRNATGKAIYIIFGIGERVKQACAAPASFAPEGRAYRAWNVTPGGVASPCFVRSGTLESTAAAAGVPGGEGIRLPRAPVFVRPLLVRKDQREGSSIGESQ